MIKSMKQLKNQKRFSREDLDLILEKVSFKVNVESYNRVLDIREELGFSRYKD